MTPSWTPDDAAAFRDALAQGRDDCGSGARALGCAIMFVSALVMLAVVVVIVWRITR